MKRNARIPHHDPSPPAPGRPVLDAHRILYLASEAGKILLQNGAEIHRVEATINRVAAAYGLEETESFVTPTGIMVSTVDTRGDTITRIRNIESRTVNLGKIAGVNELVGSIADRAHRPLSPDLLESGLMSIGDARPVNRALRLAAAATAAASFTLMFGGGPWEVAAGAVSGLFARLASEFLSGLGVNDFFMNMCGSALVTLLCTMLALPGLLARPDLSIIGALMLFVPGLAITNAIRDTLAGDLLSGVARGTEAVFVAIAVASGSGIALEIGALARRALLS
ncbi:MAG: threonine/serine exporter [Spirochaetes bacterium]|nr:MAG: threonine/serine exporter [Spirochaetota bacterium]